MDMVDLGERVGILAAQSIGEPGTQLTLRTSTSAAPAAAYRRADGAEDEGRRRHRARRPAERSSKQPEGHRVVTSYEGELIPEGGAPRRTSATAAADSGRALALPGAAGATWMVDATSRVAKDSLLFTWDPYTNPIMTDVGGCRSLHASRRDGED